MTRASETASATDRHRAQRAASQPANGMRAPPDLVPELDYRGVNRIASKELIAAIAGEAHGHVLPARLSQRVGGNLRRVREGLVVDGRDGITARASARVTVNAVWSVFR